MFRINAQHHNLDVWLIYKCDACDSTWKMEIHNRVHPKSLDPELYEGYLRNDETLATRCAFDRRLLDRCGAEVGWNQLSFAVEGPDIDLASLTLPIAVDICSDHALRIRASKILRRKLDVSGARFEALLASGRIHAEGNNLRKATLETGLRIFIETP